MRSSELIRCIDSLFCFLSEKTDGIRLSEHVPPRLLRWKCHQ
jgi:hypothetical protein